MSNKKETTGFLVRLNISEKFVERLVIILLSSLFSFNGGLIYAEQNRVVNQINEVHNLQTRP